MKFSIWLNEVEQQMTPDARQFAYIGCVLEKISQNNLISIARELYNQQNGTNIPVNWTFRAHHMTVKFKPQATDMQVLHPFMGQKIELHVIRFASDKDCCAVTVSSNPKLPIINGTPHITIAHSKAVDPVYSNALIQDKSKIISAHDNTELISILLAVQHEQDNVWPKTVISLASPSLV